jgi:hypothetical protein
MHLPLLGRLEDMVGLEDHPEGSGDPVEDLVDSERLMEGPEGMVHSTRHLEGSVDPVDRREDSTLRVDLVDLVGRLEGLVQLAGPPTAHPQDLLLEVLDRPLGLLQARHLPLVKTHPRGTHPLGSLGSQDKARGQAKMLIRTPLVHMPLLV